MPKHDRALIYCNYDRTMAYLHTSALYYLRGSVVFCTGHADYNSKYGMKLTIQLNIFCAQAISDFKMFRILSRDFVLSEKKCD
jgi:hypothetical protein